MTRLPRGRLMPMLLLLVPFICLAFLRPFGEPAQTVLEVIYLAVVLSITVMVAIRNTDEVEVAAARLSTSAGVYAGVVLTVVFLIVMTRVPVVASFVAAVAESPSSNLPPAATGFGLGALAAIFLMFVCAIIAYATRSWRSAR